jgi:hypothetical protein
MRNICTPEALAELEHATRLERAIERQLDRLGDPGTGLYISDIIKKLAQLLSTLERATEEISNAETNAEPNTTKVWEAIEDRYDVPRLLQERLEHWQER